MPSLAIFFAHCHLLSVDLSASTFPVACEVCFEASVDVLEPQAATTMGKKRKRSTEEDDGRIRKKANSNEEVPDGIYHYKSIAQVPWDAQQ